MPRFRFWLSGSQPRAHSQSCARGGPFTRRLADGRPPRAEEVARHAPQQTDISTIGSTLDELARTPVTPWPATGWRRRTPDDHDPPRQVRAAGVSKRRPVFQRGRARGGGGRQAGAEGAHSDISGDASTRLCTACRPRLVPRGPMDVTPGPWLRRGRGCGEVTWGAARGGLPVECGPKHIRCTDWRRGGVQAEGGQ